MKLDQLAGTLDVFPLDAAGLIEGWFGPDDLVYLTGKRSVKGSSKNVISQGMTAREFSQAFRSDSGAEILSSLVRSADGATWDLYLNISPVSAPLASMSERVKEVNVSHVIGIIADLDVKPGGFPSFDAIMDFLGNLGDFRPTMVVASGSGGVHAYWKFAPYRGGTVNVSMGKDIAQRWWSHLEEQAMSKYSAHIDRLYDMARMLRLPGSVRWPRPSESVSPAPVRLIRTGGPQPSITALLEASEGAWERRLSKMAKTRETDRQKHFDANELASLVMQSSENKWANYMAIAHVEDFFNELISWDDILNKCGWHRLRTDSAGRVEWARPGRDEKSATVDWPESPHVMSLLSTSHETGLADLQEAGIALSKWRVALRLIWQDNYSDMVRWTLAQMGLT